LFDRRNIKFICDRTIEVAFDGVKVGEYRPDLVVEGTVVVEVKSVLRMHPVFVSQVVTYLKITNLRVGLLLNFNCPRLKDGITRVVR
jgi:GxxExxY protein